VKRLTSIMVFVVVVTGTVRPATATIVTGYNDSSYNLHRFYIPLKTAASGTLGEPLGGGKYVGLYGDTVSLSGGSSSSGFVDFVFNFDISGLTPAEKLFLKDASLKVTFGDIDFKPVINEKWRFKESLEPTYADKASLVIDQSNYGFYTTGFVETNNRTVTYNIGLGSLGITDADASAIVAAGRFDLAARFDSFLMREAGRCTTTFSNTPETINCALISPVSEPATSLLLGAGVLLRILSRREKKHVNCLETKGSRILER